MNAPIDCDYIFAYLDAEEELYVSKVAKETNKDLRANYIYILYAIRECKKQLKVNEDTSPYVVLDILAQTYYNMGINAQGIIPKQRLATVADAIDNIAFTLIHNGVSYAHYNPNNRR